MIIKRPSFLILMLILVFLLDSIATVDAICYEGNYAYCYNCDCPSATIPSCATGCAAGQCSAFEDCQGCGCNDATGCIDCPPECSGYGESCGDCCSGLTCVSGTCRRNNGQSCSINGECVSGRCCGGTCVTPDGANPSVTSVTITENPTDGTTQVRATATDNVGVTSVSFPTWSDASGQDDLIWHAGVWSGSYWYFNYDIRTSGGNHPDANFALNGMHYTIHVYAYDATCNYGTSSSGFNTCKSAGNACTAGSECCSGNLCVNGVCRASCDGYSGYGCSTEGTAYSSASAGTCYDDLGATYGCDYNDVLRMNCGAAASCDLVTDQTFSTCTVNSGDACDSDAGGTFSQNGLCASGALNNCATSGFVSLCSGNYYNTGACPEGSQCDETLTDGDFSAGTKRYDPDDNYCDNCAGGGVIGEDGNCEYACNTGTVLPQCDEYPTGTDLVSCNYGLQTYFADECSLSCTGQDRDSICRSNAYHATCTAYGLCNGLATNAQLTSCALGQTYFADDCGAACAGEDRGDNICRSSAFASGCTATSLCNSLATNSNIVSCSAGQTYFADDCGANCAGEDRGDNICRSSAFAASCTGAASCNDYTTLTCPNDATICTSTCTHVDRDTSQAYCTDATGMQCA
jgi:hypothetical protein